MFELASPIFITITFIVTVVTLVIFHFIHQHPATRSEYYQPLLIIGVLWITVAFLIGSREIGTLGTLIFLLGTFIWLQRRFLNHAGGTNQ